MTAREHNSEQQEVERLRKENARLRDEVQALRDDAAHAETISPENASPVASISILTAPACISTLAEGRIVSVNDAFVDLFGYCREEVVGRTAEEINLTVDPAAREYLVSQLEQKGRVRNVDYTARCASGDILSMLASAKQVEIDGEACALTLLINITKRRELEKSLRESNEQLQLALEGGRLGVWHFDIQKRLFHFDERCQRKYNLPDTTSYEEIADRIHPDDLDAASAALEAAQDPRRMPRYDVEHRWLQPDGSVRWLQPTALCQFEGSGDDRSPVRIVGVVQDITERKAAEEERKHLITALQSKHQRLKTILEQMPAGVLIAETPSGCISYVNPTAQRILGTESVNAESVDEYDQWDIRDAEGQAIPTDVLPLSRALRGERIYEETIRLSAVDGSTRYLTCNAAPVRDDKGHPEAGVIALLDVTDRMRVEEKLKKLNETLEQRVQERTEQVRKLASRLSLAEQRERRRIADILHDHIQQLLFAMEMNIRKLQEETPAISSQQLRQSHQKLLDQLEETLNETLEDTRTLSVELSPPVAQSGDLVTAFQWLAVHMQERYNLEVHMDVADELTDCSDNLTVLVFQFARELLFNVVKHADVEEARIDCHQQNDYLVVTVADDGKGFDPHLVSEQSESQGLAGMQNRVQLMGGQLEVDAGRGSGTRVTIQVPLAQT